MPGGMYDLSVIDNIPFGDGGFFALRLEKPDWTEWQPGQFVMLRPQDWGLDLPWARPLSICRVTTRELVLFFQIAGRGTARFAQLQRGDHVHLWGPLGTSFLMEKGTPVLILAGGMGFAPFVAYADCHPEPELLTMHFGHRAPLEWYPMDTLGRRIRIYTYQEKSPADRAHFLDQIRQEIATSAAKKSLVLACGPLPLLQVIQDAARDYGARAQLSLENRMACGVGACLGCVVQTTEKWSDAEHASMPVQTCMHGPVFWSDQITLKRQSND